jgi:CubicO group peptidase (beta-lactamase class C family)
MIFLEQTEAVIASESSAYSHINYGVLQYLFENTSSTSFNKSIEAYLNDLGFNNTNCNLDSMFTWGINLTGEIAKPWHLQSFQASEGLFSNSYDLSQYLQDLMLNRSYLRYLKTEARKSIYRPSFQLTAGWSIITGVGKFDIFAITGKTSGHSSFIAFIPETKTAVSILCNSAEGTDDLGMLILRMINNNFKREHG